MKLIVNIYSGLADRIRSISWSQRMAKRSGRTLEVIWMQTPECGALFSDLFVNPPFTVHDSDPYPELPFQNFERTDNRICSYIFRLTSGPIKFSIVAEYHAVNMDAFCRPAPSIAELASSFHAAHLDCSCIGVHVRRGDYESSGITPAVEDYFYAIESAGGFDKIFLATDSIGVLGRFMERYRQRLVWYPVRSLDRSSREATIDSFIVLQILRRLDRFVASNYSGYSRLVTGVSRKVCVGNVQLFNL